MARRRTAIIAIRGLAAVHVAARDGDSTEQTDTAVTVAAATTVSATTGVESVTTAVPGGEPVLRRAFELATT